MSTVAQNRYPTFPLSLTKGRAPTNPCHRAEKERDVAEGGLFLEGVQKHTNKKPRTEFLF